MRMIGIGLSAVTAVILGGAAPAHAYDMDCKVILCLAGGFPAGCGDAKSYMKKRLRKGKPPFGTCTNDDGSDYKVPVKMWSRSIPSYCTSYSYTLKEGQMCTSRSRARIDYYIGITIPATAETPKYEASYKWHTVYPPPPGDRH